MITISAMNIKGGTGKTTTVWALGAALSDRGYRVLYVDADPQGNLSSVLDAPAVEGSSLDLLTGSASVEETACDLGGAWLVRSSKRLGRIDALLDPSDPRRSYYLRDALRKVDGDFDFCLIDVPPVLGTITVQVLTACSGVVVPVLGDVFSLDGVEDLAGTIDSVKDYTNPGIKIYGFLFTRFNPRTKISQVVTEMAETQAQALDSRVFTTRIREGVAIREAQAMKVGLFEYAPSSKVAVDYLAFVDELVKEVSDGR